MQRRHLVPILPLSLGLLALPFVGCSGSDDDTAPPAAQCAPQDGAPIVHDSNIEADETWSADGSPHVVPMSIAIRNGATLTIEPCAVVEIGEEQDITVAFPTTPNEGSLVAEGTAEKPIVFRGMDGATWGHIEVMAPGTATFRYVTFQNGGGDRFPHHATLVVTGNGTTPSVHDVLVDHVRIENSAGYGAVLRAAAGFAAGSTALTITGSGSAYPDEEPFPLRVGEQGMGSIPTGTYTGNVTDEILIMEEGVNGGGGLQEDATLRNLGVPYRVGHGATGSLRVVGGPDSSPTTLTIEPGVTLRFDAGVGLEISHFTGEEPSLASLVAEGTAEAPIVFTSAAATPAAGDWEGLWFGKVPNGGNHLDHVRIEYAGSDCSCDFLSCNDISEYEGAVIFSEPPADGFSITNSTFFAIAGHGIVRGWKSDAPPPDFTATNTFTDVAGCDQTLPVPATGSCPDPKPACG